GGEGGGGEEVVGHPGGETRDQVGGGGCDEEQVGGAGGVNVGHAPLGGGVPGVHPDGMAGERLKRQRRDEVGGVGGHHHAHLVAPLDEGAGQLRRLIHRNAGADA